MEKLKLYLIIAFVFSSVIFFGGIYIGYNIQGKEISNTDTQISEVSKQLDNLETMILLNSVNPNLTCSYLNDQIGSLKDRLEMIREEVASMEKDVKLRNSDEYKKLATDLIELRVRYWMLGEAVRKNCNSSISTVLFFYTTNKKCDDCIVMGYELARIGSECNVIVASIPIDSKIDIANKLKDFYNVSEVPYLVINQNRTLKGLIPQKELESILCR